MVAAAVVAFLPGNRKGLGKADCSEANRYSTVIFLRREDAMIQLSMVALYLYGESSVKPAELCAACHSQTEEADLQ